MKKNIIIVVSAMNLGGAQRVVSILCNHWINNGHKVTLISTFTGRKQNHYIVSDRVRLLSLKNSSSFANSKILKLPLKVMQLRRLIKRENPDLVISFLTRINLATTISTIGLKIPLIISERIWTPFATLNPNLFWLYRLIFKKVKKAVVQTEKSMIWLKFYFPDLDAEVIPNPVLYPIPLQQGMMLKPKTFISSKRKLILACGRLHKSKQFDLLIKSFAQVQKDFVDWDLAILGEGEEKKRLERLIHDMDCKSRVFLPGAMGNMSEWYGRADVFVLSSIVEGFPNVLLEAMSYGLPCLSFDCDTGPGEIIQDGLNGVLIDPEEKILGLSKALKKVLGDQLFRKQIAKNALQVRSKYSVNKIMERWDKILEIK
tara:strand:+ start:35662 stop:36777 length:1116 start_codon:yes stop_codon:yes gene_type:complete